METKDLQNVLAEGVVQLHSESAEMVSLVEAQQGRIHQVVEELGPDATKSRVDSLPGNPPQQSTLLSSIVIGTITTLVAGGVAFGILYGTTILQDSVLQAYEAAIIAAVSALILGAIVAGIYHLSQQK